VATLAWGMAPDASVYVCYMVLVFVVAVVAVVVVGVANERGDPV